MLNATLNRGPMIALARQQICAHDASLMTTSLDFGWGSGVQSATGHKGFCLMKMSSASWRRSLGDGVQERPSVMESHMFDLLQTSFIKS